MPGLSELGASKQVKSRCLKVQLSKASHGAHVAKLDLGPDGGLQQVILKYLQCLSWYTKCADSFDPLARISIPEGPSSDGSGNR